MKTEKHEKGKEFPTPEGTCFIKPDMETADGHKFVYGNPNPFMVVTDGDDFVECVMVETIIRADGNCKDFRWKNERDNFIEMDETHPPFEEKNICRRGYNADSIFHIKKDRLFSDENLKICCDGGKQATKHEQKVANQAKYLFANDRNSRYVDSYGDLEKEEQEEQNMEFNLESIFA